MKLSIIIPFYNALPYFNELLDSLMPQITNDVEVIFVNDASTDESSKALTRRILLLRYPRLCFENKKHICLYYFQVK